MQRLFQDFAQILCWRFFPGADSISASSYKSGEENRSGQTRTISKKQLWKFGCTASFVGRRFSPIAVDTKLLAGTCVWTER